MSTTYEIYVGPWINYSHGFISGATITLTTRDAGFLLAVLVTLAGFAGGSLWTIVSYTLHQIRSTRKARNALFLQQQAILRNTQTPFKAAASFFQLSLAWRKHKLATPQILCNLFLILAPLTIAAAFAVAGIFASRVQSAAGSALLIKGNDCGLWVFPNGTGLFSLKMNRDAIEAATYAQNCYEESSSNSSSRQCDTYPVPKIPYTVQKNASCPFQSGACLHSDTAAFSMDTGPLDSHEILGLNAPVSERVTVRKVTSCSPIHFAKYASFETMPIGNGSTDPFLLLSFGPVTGVSSYTYAYDTHWILAGMGYSLTAISPLWKPIPAFDVSEADVTLLVFASNNVAYDNPTSDDIFSANQNYTTSQGFTFYNSDYYLGPLMCADSYQICAPNAGSGNNSASCTKLTSFDKLVDGLDSIHLNEHQSWTAGLMTNMLQLTSMYNAVYGRGPSALKAQRSVTTLTDPEQSLKIPINQWQSEVEGWFGVSLALLQQRLIQYMSGPTDVLSMGADIIKPTNPIAKSLCGRQTVNNISGYQNFNTLGVIIILVTTTVLIILGLCIDTVGGYVQKLMKTHYARLSWTTDGYLQLQRMAYEGAGYGQWEGCSTYQPVISDSDGKIQVLGGLDILDTQHPRLAKQSQLPTQIFESPQKV